MKQKPGITTGIKHELCRSVNHKPPAVAVAAACNAFKIHDSELFQPSRGRAPAAQARDALILALYESEDWDGAALAGAFGRDVRSIERAVKRAREAANDKIYAARLLTVRQALKAAPQEAAS